VIFVGEIRVALAREARDTFGIAPHPDQDVTRNGTHLRTLDDERGRA
jgi:hypothetical protein